MIRTITLPAMIAALSLLGCDRTPKPADAQPSQAKAAAPGEGAACAEAAATKQLTYGTAEMRTAPDGTSYVHIGEPLPDMAEVTVAQLTAEPEKWAGKKVRVSGDVSAMCTHERAWFAVVNQGDQSGAQLQVMTAPAFLVPEGSVGKRARAVGMVEVVEMGAEHAKHLEAEHKLGSTEGTGPVKRVVVRASGADFI